MCWEAIIYLHTKEERGNAAATSYRTKRYTTTTKNVCFVFLHRLTAEELVLARGRVPRERYAGAAVVVHVSVDHSLIA